MSFLSLAYVAQIALFGAAGTMFVKSYFDMQRMRRARGDLADPVRNWRAWRFPHLRAARTKPERAQDRAIAASLLWGCGYLFAALALQGVSLAAQFSGA